MQTHNLQSAHQFFLCLYEGESGAIMEGLSDLYGELVESWVTKADPDWNHAGHRNIKDPSKSNLPDTYGGENWLNPANIEKDRGGVHYNNTVISHAAYLQNSVKCCTAGAIVEISHLL